MNKKFVLRLGIQTYQILTNEVCIPSLFRIFLAVANGEETRHYEAMLLYCVCAVAIKNPKWGPRWDLLE